MSAALRPAPYPAKRYAPGRATRHTLLSSAARHRQKFQRHELAQLDLDGHGGKGSGSGGSTATEDPNTLQSRAIVRVLELISEGEIVGLVDGAKSIFLGGVPVQREDGGANFEGVSWYQVTGTANQPYIPGFPSVETEVPVGNEIVFDTPIVHRIEELNTDSVRITMQVQGLSESLIDQQRLTGAEVHVKVEIMAEADEIGSEYVTVIDPWIISGKTTSTAEVERLFQLYGAGPWDIRVSRITPDSESVQLNNRTFWSRYTRIIDHKFNYPHSAIVGLEINSEYFGQSVATRAFEIDGLIIQVPSNYDAETRTYDGTWDGTFIWAWTNNPAWVFYDLLTNKRYGLGLDPSYVDHWSLYHIGVYCDGVVPDGKGGTEPRFTFNGPITTREDAYRVLQSLASAFRGMMFYGAGLFTAVQDSPRDVSKLFTNSNVVDGDFTYVGTSKEARHTIAVVEWTNPEIGYTTDYVVVEDGEALARYGENELEMAAYGCTSRGQAYRMGRWALLTERFEKDTVTFKAGFDSRSSVNAQDTNPGTIIRVADAFRDGQRMGGRILSGDESSLVMDKVFDFLPDEDYLVSIVLESGAVVTRAVANAPGESDTIELDEDLDEENLTVEGAVFTLVSTNIEPRLFRVLTRTEPEKHLWEITAIEHYPGKFDLADEDPTFGLRATVGQNPNNLFVAPPSDIVLTAESRRSGTVLVQSLNVGWTPSPHPLVRGYVVSYRIGSGNWQTLPLITASEVNIEDDFRGVVEVRVFALSIANIPSATISDSIDLTAPGDPEDKDLISDLEVFGGGTTFQGETAIMVWDAAPISAPETSITSGVDQFFQSFVVKVYNSAGSSLLRTEEVTVPRYDYTLEKNLADGAGRSFQIGVAVKSNLTGTLSNEERVTVSNPAPALPSHTASPSNRTLSLNISQPSDADFAGYLVWMSTSPGFTPGSGNLVWQGAGQPTIPVSPATLYYYRYAAYDAFGVAGLNVSTEQSVTTTQLSATDIADAAINIAKFAAGITPVEIVSSLPGSGNFEGRQALLTTDGKLYRYHSGAWSAAVAASDMTGTVSTSQIADDAITTDKIASSAVTATEIAGSAVTTAKIAASAVTAAEIATGAVTQAKIAANAVVASKIYVTDFSNMLMDVDFNDTAYWSLSDASVTLDTGSDVTTTLGATRAVKHTASGANPQTNGAANTSYIPVEPGKTYRIYGKQLVKSGYKGYGYLRVNWYGQGLGSPLSGDSMATGATDRRSAAAGSDIVETLDGQVTAPAGAFWAQFRLVSDWPDAAASAGVIYQAFPRMHRASAGELIVDGAVTAAKIAALTITGDKISANAITASKLLLTDASSLVLDVNFDDSAYWTYTAGAATDTSTDVTSTLAAVRGVKHTASGANPQTDSYAIAKLTPCEPSVSYRASLKQRVKSGFKGWGRLYVNWYDRTGSYFSQSVLNGTDYRSSAAGSDGLDHIEGQVTSPAGTAYCIFHCGCDWPDAAASVGSIYQAFPRLQRAASAELIVDGAIIASKIAANSIAAGKIMVGDTDNLIPNATSEDASFTAGFGSQGVYNAGAGAFAGAYVRRVLPTGGPPAYGAVYLTEALPCKAGDVFWVEAKGKMVSGTGNVRLNVKYTLTDGSTLYGYDGLCSPFNYVDATTSSWTEVSYYGVAPTNAVNVQFFGECYNASTGAVAYWDQLYARRRVTGALIVDGTITAAKILSDSITAAQIAAGAIGASEVAANAITASKIAVVDATNLVIDPNFTDATYWASGGATFDTGSDVTSGMGAVRAIKVTASGGVGVGDYVFSTPTGTAGFVVEAGKSYRHMLLLRHKSGFRGVAASFIQFFDIAGSVTGTDFAWGTEYRVTPCASDTNQTVEHIAVAPANSVFARQGMLVGWPAAAASAGIVYGAFPRAQRAMSAELIVDGTITATKIATGTITAAQIAANTITADKFTTSTLTAALTVGSSAKIVIDGANNRIVISD